MGVPPWITDLIDGQTIDEVTRHKRKFKENSKSNSNLKDQNKTSFVIKDSNKLKFLFWMNQNGIFFQNLIKSSLNYFQLKETLSCVDIRRQLTKNYNTIKDADNSCCRHTRLHHWNIHACLLGDVMDGRGFASGYEPLRTNKNRTIKQPTRISKI
jgi:hypothetical protein